jgi:hypothetical protein
LLTDPGYQLRKRCEDAENWSAQAHLFKRIGAADMRQQPVKLCFSRDIQLFLEPLLQRGH